MADNPPQQQRLKNIHAGYEECEEYDSRIIALRRAGKADPTLYENQQRKHQMDLFESRSRSFKALKKDCVPSAFKPRTGDGS